MNRVYYKMIWFFTVFLVGIGLLAIYSASYENVRVSQQVFYQQLVAASVGFLLMWGVSQIYYGRLYDWANVFYVINIVLLLWVMFSGSYALGATRWIALGPVTFQPSEFSKLAIIVFLARYFAKRASTFSFSYRYFHETLFRDLIYPLCFTLFTMLLIFKQPDLGTSLLIFGIFLIMLFASGINIKIFSFFIGFCLASIPVGWFFLKSYQKDRLLVFLNPNIDPLGAGYTIIQSKIAVGSGKLLGKGWLSGTQNQLNFLPERHTDFIFSVIGEEWGLFGCCVTILCYFMLIYAGLKVAENLKDLFGRFLAIGIIGILTLQVVINIGMVIGLSPVVGLTLPFISYGRTSFIIFMVLMGILLNLSKKRTLF